MAYSIGIDIGSTWTKGALFEHVDNELILRQRASHPTTVHDLSEGFAAVLGPLTAGAPESVLRAQLRSGELALSYSSSAKGGLAVAAVGLVPDITLETAKLAAYSAGAKLTQVLSYRLTPSDIRQLELSPPDILLFAGGTDGGNTDYVLANARALAKSSLTCSMVYAGNRDVSDEVSALLVPKGVVIVENLLPSLDAPNPEPAREALRTIFLQRIVKGKGLDRVVEIAGCEPAPTPYAMFEFTKAIREHVAGWGEFILLDIGGATTDVYSAHRESPCSGTVVRGLPEPDVKRTVEGDLGMRVSAKSTWAGGRASFAGLFDSDKGVADLSAYVEKVSADPNHLAVCDAEERFDSALAGFCLAEACTRHAGRSHEVSTPEGLVQLQVGRDLRHVKKAIGSGGWLAQAESFDPSSWFRQRAFDARGRAVLLPSQVNYFRDAQYLFPLLANVARQHPAAAARAAIRSMNQLQSGSPDGTHQSLPVFTDLCV